MLRSWVASMLAPIVVKRMANHPRNCYCDDCTEVSGDCIPNLGHLVKKGRSRY